MKQLNIDEQELAVRQFLESLAAASEETAVQANGKIVLRILPPNLLGDDEKQVLIERRRELMRQACDRAKSMKPEEIDRLVQDAVDEVRGRTVTQ